jgi:hypothetical protein
MCKYKYAMNANEELWRMCVCVYPSLILARISGSVRAFGMGQAMTVMLLEWDLYM